MEYQRPVSLPPAPLPRTGRRPLLAYPLNLSSIVENPFARCRALVILIDLERKDAPPEDSLRSIFKLTVAEMKLASRLAAGETVEQASEQLGIAKETARNQLKAVFRKTDVRRQSELVALFNKLTRVTP